MKEAQVLSYPMSTQRRLRLGGCPGWSESSLGAHVILLVLSRGGSLMMKFCSLCHHGHFTTWLPKNSDTWKICCNHPQIWTTWIYHRVMRPKDAEGIANSVDPDRTAPLGAVWSGSALFAQTYLSENLGSLLYSVYKKFLQLSGAYLTSVTYRQFLISWMTGFQ